MVNNQELYMVFIPILHKQLYFRKQQQLIILKRLRPVTREDFLLMLWWGLLWAWF